MFFWFSNQPRANLCIDHICCFVQSLVFLSSIPSVAAALRYQPGQLLLLIRGLFQVNQLEPIGHLCLWFPTEHCFLRSTVIAGNLASELSGSVRSQIVILSKIGVFTESRLKVFKVGGAWHSKNPLFKLYQLCPKHNQADRKWGQHRKICSLREERDGGAGESERALSQILNCLNKEPKALISKYTCQRRLSQRICGAL